MKNFDLINEDKLEEQEELLPFDQKTKIKRKWKNKKKEFQKLVTQGTYQSIFYNICKKYRKQMEVPENFLHMIIRVEGELRWYIKPNTHNSIELPRSTYIVTNYDLTKIPKDKPLTFKEILEYFEKKDIKKVRREIRKLIKKENQKKLIFEVEDLLELGLLKSRDKQLVEETLKFIKKYKWHNKKEVIRKRSEIKQELKQMANGKTDNEYKLSAKKDLFEITNMIY